MFKKGSLLVIALCMVFAVAAQAADLDDVREARLDSDFSRAVGMLQGLAKADSAHADMYLYLLADSYHRMNKFDNALAALDRIFADHSGSKWYYKALFKKADILIAQKQFGEAARIYEGQSERLLSQNRKILIANIYIGYADDFFQPPDEDTPPDYNRALRFYQRAVDVGLTGEKLYEVKLRMALCHYNQGSYGEASNLFTSLLDEDELPEPVEREAMFYSGMNNLSWYNPAQARKAFRRFLEKYPNDKNAATAAYNIGKTYNLPNPGSLKDLELGVKAHREFLEKYSTHEDVPAAAFEIAESYYNMERYEEAVVALTDLVRQFGRRSELDEVPRAKILLGRCYFDQEKYERAIEEWKKYLKDHPTHSGWSNTSSRAIDAEFAIAKKAMDDEQYITARSAFDRFLDAHPLDNRARDAMFELGNIEFLEENWMEAIKLWEKLVSKHPGSDQASRAQLLIGEINECKFNDPEAALAAYKEVTGSQAGEAQARIAALQNKELTVLTERAYTTNEKAKLKFTIRNMPELHFRAYRIDMETYFKKYHDWRGVEKLDIALIDPDKTWDYTVEDYRKMRPYELDLDLPLKEPGAYAITVGDDEIEATTMLLITDMAVIVKSSKNSVFVFAEDMARMAPAAGARVLISDGVEVFEAGKTGGDGVLQYRGDKVRNAGDIGVLLVKSGSVASNKLYVGDLSYVAAAQPRGIIYTERPAYRPGQTVKARGILRDNKDGVYTFKQGEKFRVDVLSPGGLGIYSDIVELNAFGAFAMDHTLDQATALGWYTITATEITDKEAPRTYSNSFQVQEYKLERVKMSVELDREIYFRGETVKGKIKAAYYFGQPVVGKEIQYVISSENKTETAETDENGEVAIEVDTSDFEENSLLSVSASMTGENVGASKAVWVAATGFDMTVETLRDVYLAGESVEVTVKSSDLAGNKVSSDVRLEVLQRITKKGRSSEVRVRELDLTEAKTGISRGSVTLKDGGYYVLRAFSRDRFDNPVAAELVIFISGEDDENKLRIVTEREEYRVGESPGVKLVYRDDPAPALITFEGEVIYGYRLVDLKNGENTLAMNISDDLAPNFTLGVAVMRDNRFHQTNKAFNVVKGLEISIKPDKDTYEPGETMKLKVETTDQNGKPVPAEISLALVDEALYTLYADSVPPLGEFFFGDRRAAKFNTISSNTFSYDGVTKMVPKEFVEELGAVDAMKLLDATTSTGMDMDMEGDGMYYAVADEEYEEDFDDYAGGYAENEKSDKKEKRKDGGRSAGKMAHQAMPPPSAAPAGIADMPKEYAPEKPGAAAPRLRDFFPETGYWNPHVETGADGTATLDVTMPDTATTWRLTSRGATAKTLVGEQTVSVVTRQDFFITVKQPQALVQGDTAGFFVEVHNLTATEREANISADLDVEGAADRDSHTVKVDAKSTAGVLFQFKVHEGKKAVLNVEARAGDRGDKVRVEIPARPFGVEVAEVKSGMATSETTAYIELPQSIEPVYPEMIITLSPSLQRAVLDVEFPWSPYNDATALEAISVLHRLAYLERIGAGKGGDTALLAARAQGLITRLVSTQNNDGSWSWVGWGEKGRGNADITVTTNAVWALSMAQKRGITMDPAVLEKSVQYLTKTFSSADGNEAKAEILHALSLTGQADFAYLNRLDRERSSLSVRAMAFLVLSYMNQDRPELAADMATALVAEIKQPRSFIVDDYPGAEVERTRDLTADLGLALMALARATPTAPAVKEYRDYIESVRWGNSWSSAEATMSASCGLALSYGGAAHAADRFKLSVLVNDQAVHTLDAGPGQSAVEFRVPAGKFNGKGKNKVTFQNNGRGAFAWSVVLKGFVREPSKAPMRKYQPEVDDRTIEAAPPRFKGKEYQPGFDVVDGSYSYFQNTTDEAAMGDYVTVSMGVKRPRNDKSTNDVVVLEDSIPAGCTVDKDSISGGFDHYELKDGRIRFYCSGNCYVKFKLFGYLPGEYQMLPAVVHPASDPWRRNYQSTPKFKVLKQGEAPSKEYRLTPDQLYELGADYFEEDMYGEAETLLTQLLNGYALEPEPFKETHRMLMYICIEKNDSACIVDHFEQLKERYPSLSVDFEDILRVGRAYRDMNENERAIQLYRTALEASFMTDGEARLFLEDQGKLLDAIGYLDDLALEYPDLNMVQNAVYSTGHALFSKAANVNAVPDFKEKEMTKGDVVKLAVGAWRRYMLLYPQSPFIDEAGFSEASAFFDMEQNNEVIGLTRTLQKRYPKSPFLDSYQYLEAYGHFELGDYSKALELCRRVAEGEYYDATGALGPSDSKNLALYITAQIYHTMNKPDKAAEYYEMVSEQFTDAAGALDYFNLESFSIPELTTAPSGKSATVELTHRNIQEAELKVYRVDLMKFYLLRKSMQGMSQIQLSGVKPIYEKRLTLAKGREYRDQITNLKIPLDRDGAYLVVLKSPTRYISGMLLRSNLDIQVQEDSISGRVRVNVLDRRSGRYVSKAHVKVVGSGDGRIQSGFTDMRGIFTAEGISGRAAVIVKKDDQYAFFSGDTDLQQITTEEMPFEAIDFKQMRGYNTQNIYEANDEIQMRNDAFMNDNFQRQEGIQIQQIEQNMYYDNNDMDIQQIEAMPNQMMNK